MRPFLPRWWRLAAKTAAWEWQGLWRVRATAGRVPWAGSCPLISLSVTRCCCWGRGPAEPEDGKQGSNKPLKEWTLVVSPFGRLKVRLPCHVTVCSLDPHQYPDADRVLVTVRGMNTASPHGADLDNLHVKYDEALKEMAIISDDVDNMASVDVRTPVKFDLDIKTSGDGCVKAENMDCDRCQIETEMGNSILQSIKSQKIDIQAKGGNVICLGTLQGNVDIRVSQESGVNIEKLQGSSINISTKDGLLKTKYLYAESSFLSSEAGDILLGNVHGDTTVQSQTGNITIDSSEGFLKASTYQGEMDIYIVGQVGEADLKSQKGSITVKVPTTLKAHLWLSGRKVEVSPEIQLQGIQDVSREGHVTVTGHLNQKEEKEIYIKAETQNGTVHLKSQTWFQSVKLKTA
ncbi:protein FAM185A [Tiliqua scincoides]|uniref:protein FAM185A n=1 Tax=Tiliqua scincoides TaxID=71010 RepID=UPI00346377E2